ncbi:hypothetical protein Ancab_014217 [Ancistrocladus abbreviatus]
MAEFPPNLDDGELWIPSDILPEELGPSYSSTSSCNHHHHQQQQQVEDLARHFSTMALLDHRPQKASKILLPSPPQRSGPAAIQHLGAASQVTPGYCVTLRPEVDLGLNGRLGTGLGNLAQDPLLEYRLVKPVQRQAEGSMETTRAAANRQLQTQQNRPRTSQGGEVKLGGGFKRDCGGTGVFLPRIASTVAAALSTHETTHVDGAKRKQGMRSGQHAQSRKQGETGKRVSSDKRKEYQRQFPSDLALPKDWTY